MSGNPTTKSKITGLNGHIIVEGTHSPRDETYGISVNDIPELGIQHGDAVLYVDDEYYSFEVEGRSYLAIPNSALIASISEPKD